MNKTRSQEESPVHADMTILDIVSQFRKTEAVFRKYDEKARVCLCCEALFEPLKSIAEKYRLNLENLLADLNAAITSHKDME